MYFNTNETSLRTKEPSRKLLRRSIAAFPAPAEATTEPSITNDSVVLSIPEPTITDDCMPETTVNPAEQVNVNPAEQVKDFFSKSWNHKLKYNDWKVYFFICTIISTLLNYIGKSIQKGDNHYRLNGFNGLTTRFIKWVCLKTLKRSDPEDELKREERISFGFHIFETLIFLVFPALVLSGVLTCPAIIMNFLMLVPVILAYISTWLISSLGATCGVGLTMIFFAFEVVGIIRAIVNIFRSKFQNEVHFKIPDTTERDYKEIGADKPSVDSYRGVKAFCRHGSFLRPYLTNIFVPSEMVSKDGLNIDNSKGYANSFILEIKRVLGNHSMQLHYLTKDSMVYSQREVLLGKVTIHGTKITDNGIERANLMRYDGIPAGVWNFWTQIRPELEQKNPAFDFIPQFTECFAPQ